MRALAEQEAEDQAGRAEACEENAGPIAATVANTAASQTALAEHEAAVARREAANQAQQQRQTEAAGLVAGYPSRATGLAALEVPLTASGAASPAWPATCPVAPATAWPR